MNSITTFARNHVIHRQCVRRLHSTCQRRDRVAPPDSISHMRPIIYDDAPGPLPTLLRHPYSLAEFKDATTRQGNHELQFKLQRQQLDAFHQNFWLDSNTRRNAAMEAIFASLPSTTTERNRENAFSEFNQHWVLQEKSRTDQYTIEWRKRNLALIKLGVRVQLHNLASRISQLFRSR